MKRIFLIFISLVMLLTGSGLVMAEEKETAITANLTDKTVKSVMENTVMLRPNALDAFAYGKKYSLEECGEATRENGRIMVSAEFLKKVFPNKAFAEERVDLAEFASENNMKVQELDGNVYMFNESYKLPSSISGQVTKFFGIYVKEGAKGTGTFENPAGNITSAKNLVSGVKKSIGLPDGGITVYFREGKYVINNIVNFTAADSGMEGSPICYKAYKNEDAAFNGGITIKGTEFGEITDISVKNKLPYPEKVAAVYIGDKISQFGDSFKTADPATWTVFYNDEFLNVARWPNKTWALTGEVLDDGGKVRGKGFSFVIGDTRIKKWVNEDDPRIFGYFGYDWAGERRGIAEIDTQKLSVKTDNFAEYGIASGKRYYVYNMVCELDSPGEFYYDNKTDYLYFYPVEGDPKNSNFLANDVQFSLHSQEMFNMNDTSYVNFEKITFENSLSYAIKVNSTCKNVAVNGCTIKNIAYGIDLYGFNNTIRSCDFYNITVRPVGALGGDRATLTPSGNLITNNKFWNFNISSRTNTAAISTGGCGDVISYNEICDSPHTAVTMNGNDNIIEYNEIYNCLVDGATDAGAFYGGRNLSVVDNVYRNNYFHDLACKSIGVIYFDDGMSGNHVEGNVFENTGTGIFVHGGIASRIKDNLFLGGTGSGAGFSSASYSWKMETATSESANGLLYKLKTTVPYQSEIWQTKYNFVFKYLEIDEKPILMRDHTVTGNIMVGKAGSMVSAPEADKALMTIENNTEIPAEEAERFEISEHHKNVMETAGVYVDEYRTGLDALTDFSLRQPYNKEDEVEASEVYFEWEASKDAYSYQFTLATDKEFKNIISNKIVTENHVTLEKLNYFNTRYYWKVKAIANDTNSVTGDREKMCREEYYSFTTKAVEVVSREKLTEQIELCENTMAEVSEGENPGEYKLGVKEEMQALVDRYKKSAASESLTQKEVNNLTSSLKSEFDVLTYKRNPEIYDLTQAVNSGTYWNFTPNQTVFTPEKLTLLNQTSAALGSAEKISPHMTYKFKVKWNGFDDGWMGIGLLAQASATSVPWSGNPMYFTIFKKDTVEFQKWGSGATINLSFENKYIAKDQWVTYEFSAIAQDDGSNLVTWKMDGETVYEYVDNDMPINTPGFLYIYNGVKDATFEIMPVKDGAEEE